MTDTAGSASGDVQVLVVGAGPVGLTAAHELARRGVRVRLVDRAAGPATTSRATATHARTLEIYRQMGIVDDLAPRGQQVEHFTLHRAGRPLIVFDTNYDRLPTLYPHSVMVDQIITEEVLRAAVERLGVEIEWGVELTAVGQDDDGVDAELMTGGVRTTVRVPWLVGADGGHSLVRSTLGLELEGESTHEWLVADAIVHADLPRDSLHWMHTRTGPILLVPFPDAGRWRLLDTIDVNRDDDAETVRARFAKKISVALGRDVAVETPSWMSVFTIQQRMIRSMGNGRCFVAGDAAHVHSPASGQGMNTGIQDAFNLAWKLADVVNGHADTGILDSYSDERVPIGERLLESTKLATALVALQNAAAPVLLPLGTGMLKIVTPLKRKIEHNIMKGMSALALSYPQSPLSLPRAGTATMAGPTPGERIGCSIRDLELHPGWAEVVAELTDPRWLLLGFAGGADVDDALREVAIGYGMAVSVRIVRTGPRVLTHPSGQPPEAGTPRTDVLRDLVDPTGGLGHALGAADGDYLLVRPDGYLAARGSVGPGTHLVDVLGRARLVPGRGVVGSVA